MPSTNWSSTTATSYRFIDTAGIRRKGKTKLMAEKLSVVMARKHLEAADVALLVIDAVEGVTALDANIAGYAHESGRSVIIVVNKWDLVGPGRPDGKKPADRNQFEQQVRDALKFLSYAPVLFVSATSGKGMDKVVPVWSRWRRAAEAHLDLGDEPLPREGRFRARLGARVEAGEDLLHDAGRGRPADVHPVHRPAGEAALLLSAISGEPDSARRSALWARPSGSRTARARTATTETHRDTEKSTFLGVSVPPWWMLSDHSRVGERRCAASHASNSRNARSHCSRCRWGGPARARRAAAAGRR